MITTAFEYHRPATVEEVVYLLSELHGEARALAGGHSLIPMMKLGLANPDHLLDLNRLDELRGVAFESGVIALGAMVVLNEIIANGRLAEAAPILREAALQMADPQVRNCGTVGGNIANGDPGNDMPAVMLCLDASYELAGPGGVRTVAARDFHLAAFRTARADDEILTRIVIPVPDAGIGHAYVMQKHIGNYATAAAAILVGGGEASVAMTNLADVPVRSEAAGMSLAAGDVEGCVAAALADIDPREDLRGPVEFKRHVAAEVLRCAVDRALRRGARGVRAGQ